MDVLDAKIESATETLAKLTQNADAAMSKHDVTTAFSVDIATSSYTTIVFEEIVTYVDTSSTTVYPHSLLAPGSSQKLSVNSKEHLVSKKKWKEVLSLGADVGVDVQNIHSCGLTLKHKACDIN